jgi:beta-lactamase superfamily II metal-dependent hydrolase
MAKKAAKAKKTKAKKAVKAARKTAAKKASRAPQKTAAGQGGAATAPASGGPVARLLPPPNSVTVRFYRIGHGDCFLLAFATTDPNKPVYVLIDCGYKPGSPAFINTKAKEIGQHIVAATGGRVHVAVITHEHQDHVNGITEANFNGLTIDETWLAWTEDPEDDIANDLRTKFKDKLVGLIGARMRLAAAGEQEEARKLDEFIAFEFGGDDDVSFTPQQMAAMLGAAKGGGMSANKKSMKLFKDLANDVRFLRPHEEIAKLRGTQDVRVFVLGPPRDPELLKTLDPEGGEEFHSLALSRSSSGNYFAAAAGDPSSPGARPPFGGRYCIPFGKALRDRGHGAFFRDHYGGNGAKAAAPSGNRMRGEDEVDDNEAWRRIDTDWLHSADQLALDMNGQTNNSSLVLAFELGKGGKVLLFAADAQRGNWLSWAKKSWRDGRERVTAKDLLARTVLYKAGHHCSHNATLNGQLSDIYANLSWMAHGDHGREFTAMITAVRKWAETQKGWDHPFAAIKDALLKKTSGRVFQTDTDLEAMTKADNSAQVEWADFQSRTAGERLFFDYTVRA